MPFTVNEGIIATSDNFPVHSNMYSIMQKQPIDAIDMESAAFHQTCHLYQKPSFVVRGISNVVARSDDEHVLINKVAIIKAAENAAQVVGVLLSHINAVEQ